MNLPTCVFPTSHAADKLATLRNKAIELDRVAKPFVYVDVEMFLPTWAVGVRIVWR